MSTGVSSARAVCIVRDPVLRRTLRRSLCSNGTTVEFRESLDGGLPPDAILFVDRESWQVADLAALTHAVGEHGRVVFLGGSLDDHELVVMLRERALDHVIADRSTPDELELAVTSAKLHSGDIFGLEKYLAWGVSVTGVEVAGYDDKTRALDELGRAAESVGARRRLIVRVQSTADELLMNALYDAPTAGAAWTARGTGSTPALPVDTARLARTRALSDADAAAVTSARSSVLLRYACDGRYLAVSVLDRFGSFDKRDVFDAVLRARTEMGRPRAQGGAGLGLYFVLSSVTRFIVNVRPGQQTEVVCLFDVRERGREAAGWARSLHVFTAA